eukprot:gene5762-6059_t
MAQKKRAQAIEAFQGDPPTTVFLLSMRSGAVGINLTAANYVFIMEPSMNPALEEQAIGRAWRMGQLRAVTVKKLCFKNSIEERMIQVSNHTPQYIIPRCLGQLRAVTVKKLWFKDSIEERMIQVVKSRRDASALDPSGSRSAGAVGSLQTDKADLRIQELDCLFKERC